MSDCSQAVTLIGCIAERVRTHQAELWLRVCAAMCPQTGSQRYPLQPAPRHPRYDTFPGEVLLRLATARSAGAGQPTGSGALGGDAGAVPARVHVPRPGNRKLQFAVLAVAALRGGTDSRGLRAGRGEARREHLQQARPGSVGRRPPPDAGRFSVTWSPDRRHRRYDLTHHARSPVLGYGTTTVAGSLPLLTCMGSWGIGGISGIPSGAPLVISAASSSLKSASDAESCAVFLSPAGADGVNLSKNRSSSTGTGMTSVLFFSAATSTTVCSSRSWSAAGSRDMTLAAAARRLEAWYSPSAVMIRARRSRSASACRDIDRFMLSGRETSLSSTRSTRMPHGPSVGSSMIRRSSRLTESRSESS